MYFSFLSKVPANEPPQVPKQGPYEERGPFTRHFAYLSKTPSFEFPSKGALPLMESLAERCPTTRALLHSSIKVPDIRAPSPYTRFPPDGKGPPWREMPVSGDFLNTYSRVPSEGAYPPRGPLQGASSERDTSSTEPPSSISQTGPLWK